MRQLGFGSILAEKPSLRLSGPFLPVCGKAFQATRDILDFLDPLDVVIIREALGDKLVAKGGVDPYVEMNDFQTVCPAKAITLREPELIVLEKVDKVLGGPHSHSTKQVSSSLFSLLVFKLFGKVLEELIPVMDSTRASCLDPMCNTRLLTCGYRAKDLQANGTSRPKKLVVFLNLGSEEKQMC